MTSKPTEAQQQEHVEAGRATMAAYAEVVRGLADANRALLAGGGSEYTFTGSVEITSAIICSHVDALATTTGGSDPGVKLHFKGDAWGLGLGKGVAFGGGSFGYLSPDDIAGHCTFEVHAIGVGPGMVQVTWIRGSRLLGTFIGGGPELNITLPSGGSGTWAIVTEREGSLPRSS